MKDNKQYIDEIFQKYETIKKNKKHKIENKFIKMVAMVIIVIGATAGIVYASNIIYQKVWKEPQEYNFFEEIQVSEDDKKKSLTEQQAINKAKTILQNIGKSFGDVKSAELKKVNNKLEWYIIMDNQINIDIDAKTGKLSHFSDWGVDDTKVSSTMSKQNVEKVVNDMYLKLGYKQEEYELATLEKSLISDDANIWRADFCKKYDGIFNIYQCIRISVIPEANQLMMLTIFDYDFENNPIVITKEEATQIAKDKNVQLRESGKIQNIETKLDIRKMNEYVYLRELAKDGNYGSYRTEDIVRKVWVVEITYENELFVDKDIYFVDCTTGEIIGGDSVK